MYVMHHGTVLGNKKPVMHCERHYEQQHAL